MAAATAPHLYCAGGKSSPHELLRKLGIKHSRRSLRDPENLKFQQVCHCGAGPADPACPN